MWWFLTAVVCTIVGFFLAALLAFVFSNYGDDKGRFAVVSVAVMAILYAIANSIAYNKTSEHEIRVATYAEAASAYDFSSGYEYPLDIGSRSMTASGEVSVSGGMFSVNAYAKIQGGSSILIGFQHRNGAREIIEVPLSNIEFRIVNDETSSSIVIGFGRISTLAYGYTAEDMPDNCHLHIRWGWLTNECSLIKGAKVNSSTDEGLSGLLQKALASGNAGKFVVVSVTEAGYRQILGSAGSTTETETPTPSPTQR